MLKLYALGRIDEVEFRSGKDRADIHLAELALKKKSLESLLAPLDYFVKRAVMALEHLDVTWKTASETNKRKIAKTLFPDGFTCDKDGRVGTPQIPTTSVFSHYWKHLIVLEEDMIP